MQYALRVIDKREKALFFNHSEQFCFRETQRIDWRDRKITVKLRNRCFLKCTGRSPDMRGSRDLIPIKNAKLCIPVGNGELSQCGITEKENGCDITRPKQTIIAQKDSSSTSGVSLHFTTH